MQSPHGLNTLGHGGEGGAGQGDYGQGRGGTNQDSANKCCPKRKQTRKLLFCMLALNNCTEIPVV
jgi:hypothetical protein